MGNTSSKDNDLKGTLAGGLLGAILMFGKSLGRAEISQFDLGDLKIILQYSPKYELYYVLVVDKREKESKDAEMHLNLIQTAFEFRFRPEQTIHWDGNMGTFLPFKAELPKIFKKK